MCEDPRRVTLHVDQPRSAYRRTTTPLRQRRSSISSRSSRTPPGKNRFPLPTTTGQTIILELVDQTRPYCLRGELRTVNRDVVLSVGMEFTLDFRPYAPRLCKGPGVNDLLCRLPLPCKVEHEPRLIAKRVRGLPVHHCLVNPPSVEIGTE